MIRRRCGQIGQSFLWLLIFLGSAGPVLGQTIGSSLSLDEAVGLARQNNPNFLMTANNQSAADWGEREAFAAFLPTINTSLSGQYLAPGIPSSGIYTGEDFGIGST